MFLTLSTKEKEERRGKQPLPTVKKRSNRRRNKKKGGSSLQLQYQQTTQFGDSNSPFVNPSLVQPGSSPSFPSLLDLGNQSHNTLDKARRRCKHRYPGNNKSNVFITRSKESLSHKKDRMLSTATISSTKNIPATVPKPNGSDTSSTSNILNNKRNRRKNRNKSEKVESSLEKTMTTEVSIIKATMISNDTSGRVTISHTNFTSSSKNDPSCHQPKNTSNSKTYDDNTSRPESNNYLSSSQRKPQFHFEKSIASSSSSNASSTSSLQSSSTSPKSDQMTDKSNDNIGTNQAVDCESKDNQSESSSVQSDLPSEPKPLSNSQLKKLKWKEWMKKQKMDQRMGLDSRMQEMRDQYLYGAKKDGSESLVTSPRGHYSLKAELTSQIAIDCEMVGAGPRGCRDMVARVSIVNTFGHVLYDTYVAPVEKVTDYRTFVSGIYPHHLQSATDFSTIQREVCSLLKDRVLVGHAIANDLKVLYLTHPMRDIRDTAKYFSPEDYGGRGQAPSLKKLTQHHLGVKIQKSSHDSVEDARAAMRLYMLFKKEWEEEISAKFGDNSFTYG